MTPAQLSHHLSDRTLPKYGIDLDPECPLDRWIVYAVKVLRDGGIETYESCHGGPGHSYPEPTVRFHGQSSEGYRAVAIAITYGLPIQSLRRVWHINGNELEGPTWEITFKSLGELKRLQLQAESSGILS